MNVKDTISSVFAKLLFKTLAEKIPESTQAKAPVLKKAIPFANQIVCGLAVLVVVVAVACTGKGGGSSSGGRASPASDFSYRLVEDDEKNRPSSTGSNIVIPVSDGVVITGYSGNGGKVVIPATIEDIPVVMLYPEGDNLLRGQTSTEYKPANAITELVIPEGVEMISGNAFMDCENLTTVTLPASLKYLRGFQGCPELVNLNMPDSPSFDIWVSSFDVSQKLPLKIRQQIDALKKATREKENE